MLIGIITTTNPSVYLSLRAAFYVDQPECQCDHDHSIMSDTCNNNISGRQG